MTKIYKVSDVVYYHYTTIYGFFFNREDAEDLALRINAVIWDDLRERELLSVALEEYLDGSGNAVVEEIEVFDGPADIVNGNRGEYYLSPSLIFDVVPKLRG